MSNVPQKTQVNQCETAKDSFSEIETAAHLDICIRTLANWRNKGIGPVFFKCGKKFRYPRSGLVGFEMPLPQRNAQKKTTKNPV
jgi:hypothetical protein